MGPSMRWYPMPHAHVILAEFIGLNRDTLGARTVASSAGSSEDWMG